MRPSSKQGLSHHWGQLIFTKQNILQNYDLSYVSTIDFSHYILDQIVSF